MNEPNEIWNQLTQRGNRRGADSVLQAAVLSATASAAGATPTVDANGHDIPAVDMTSANHPPRASRTRRGVGALGLAALLGVGGFATLSVQGNGGGADSPAQAVERLADAINHEDLLAAIDIMMPDEVRSLHATVDKAQQKAADEQLVQSATKPLAGLELDVENLKTRVESVADGFAKVHVSGLIHAQTNSADFGRMLRNAVNGDNTSSDIDLADLSVADSDPFVMVVRDGDGWYISPAYTGIEYARVAQDLPAAEFGASKQATLGADSPEAAASDMLRAVADQDWNKVASLVPPNEFPLYDYRAAFTKMMNDSIRDSFTISEISSTAKIEGNNATVSVNAQGTTDNGDKWSIRNSCLKYTEPYSTREGTALAPEMCISPSVVVPFGLVSLRGTGSFKSPQSDSELRATKYDGRWYVTPMGTLLEGIDDTIRDLTRNDLAAFLDQPLEVSSSGSLTLNASTTVPKGAASRRYTFRVTKPETVVTRVSDINGYVEVLDNEGVRVEPNYDYESESPEETYELHPNVEYSLVVRTFIQADFTLAVWRQVDAPALPVRRYTEPDGSQCVETANSTSCTSTETPPTTRAQTTETTFATAAAP